jgi:AraC-like DNA-binding protein/mannose-6-phosphate isomerase-like protein (cupin superfamily)
VRIGGWYPVSVGATLYQPFPIAGTARGQIWRHQPSTRRPRHFHAEPELNLVTAGRGAFGFGAQVVEVVAGDLLCWTPGQDHELLSASDDFDLFVIGLMPEFSERVLGDDARAPHRGPVLLRLSQDQLATLAPRCLFPALHGDMVAKERAVGDLWQLAHSLRDASTLGHNLTRRSLGFVNERPEISRGEIARRSHASPGEVSRQFRRDMGLPLSAFRARIRLLRFIQMVDEGNTFLHAALAAGFGSYSQCHRVFQSTLGCTPRIYFDSPVRRAVEDAFAPFAL